MNRDRLIQKDIANKHAQAREHYEHNKPLLAESKLHEKDSDFQPQNEDIKDKDIEDDMQEEKVIE